MGDIFSMLNWRDLRDCVAVSKEWRRHAERFLYQSPVGTKDLLICIRNHHLIWLYTVDVLLEAHKSCAQSQDEHPIDQPSRSSHRTRHEQQQQLSQLDNYTDEQSEESVVDKMVRWFFMLGPRRKPRTIRTRWNALLQVLADPSKGRLVRIMDFSTLSSLIPDINDQVIFRLARSLPCLMRLNMTRCDQLTDEALLALSYSAAADTIRCLNISECHKITDLGLSYIARSMSRLRAVGMKHCWNVTGQCNFVILY
jgi:hypothetical protein